MFLAQIGVVEAAALLYVTPQRVRRLLADGRIPGTKHPVTGVWQVPYPFTVRTGTRGPRFGARMRALQAKKPQKRNSFCTKPRIVVTL